MALVMYDLDGTLLDTVSELTCAVNLTLSLYGQASVEEEQVRNWVGYGTESLMKQAWHAPVQIPEQGWAEVMGNFVRYYVETMGTTSKLYPYVRETLYAFKRKGIKQAIVTNKEQKFTARLLEKHDLANIFDLIVCGDTLPVRKPDPAVIHYCISTMSETVDKCLFVGDSDIDIATAKSAGIKCFAVPYGYNRGRDIRLSNPDRLIGDIREVQEFFIETMAA